MTTSTRPASGAEITAEWLTDVLRDEGATVTDARVERIAVGVGFVSDLYRVHLTGPGCPPSVIVKLPTDSPYRAAAEQVGAYVRELTFYRDIAPAAPLRTPHSYRADGATGPADASEFALVMEDLGSLEPADHLAGLPLHRAESVIDALATFHAWSATVPLPAAFPALDDEGSRTLLALGPATGWATYLAHAREPVPNGVRRVIEDYPAQVDRLTAALATPAGLAHGDLRADNLFFAADGTPALVDFQFAVRGSGMYDVAYLVSQGLAPAVRRGRERELVERYRTALGRPDYDAATAWRQFRVASLLACTFPLVAIGGWDALGERARELCLALVERALDTIAATDAGEVLA